MKKMILLCLMLCLCGCTSTTQDTNKQQKSACGDEEASACRVEESADMSEYENFTDKDNQFIKSDIDSVLNLIKKGKSAVVYFGFPKCPWCIEALPIINAAAKQENVEVLYVQTRDADKKPMYSDSKKQKIMSYTDAYLQVDEQGEKQFYVPFVIVVKDGNVVAAHTGTVDGYDTSERKMNDEEKAQLKNIYLEMFKKL